MSPLFFVLWSTLVLFGLLQCSGGGTEEAGGSSETVYENTSRSGTVASEERWKGTITVTGDITIPLNMKLTIDPGTTVRLAASADDQSGGSTTPITDAPFPNDPAIAHSQITSINLTGGTLEATGTVESPITFTSAASTPKWGDWDSLQYNKAGSRMVLRNTVIEYGYYGVQINDAADDTHITLQDNTIRQIVACGICGSPTETISLTLSGNDISNCGHEGVATFSSTTFVIDNNIFHDNLDSYGDGRSAVGVNIDGNASTIRNNQFLRNWTAIGILSEASHPIISGNTFEGNDSDCAGGFCPSPLQ